MALLGALADLGPLTVVMEPKSWVPWGESAILRAYWQRVHDAEDEVFPPQIINNAHGLTISCVPMGEASKITRRASPTHLLDADRFIVFGSSYITGWLAEELISRGALNLHGGLAPYYRGAAPNAWAWRDGNRHLVGAQVQRLSKGLDAGEILATSRVGDFAHGDPFLAGMLAVKRGHELLRVLLGTKESWIPVMKNDRTCEVAYHRSADFTEEIAAELLRDADRSR
jgi:hypothetical protein